MKRTSRRRLTERVLFFVAAEINRYQKTKNYYFNYYGRVKREP